MSDILIPVTLTTPEKVFAFSSIDDLETTYDGDPIPTLRREVEDSLYRLGYWATVRMDMSEDEEPRFTLRLNTRSFLGNPEQLDVADGEMIVFDAFKNRFRKIPAGWTIGGPHQETAATTETETP